ncbi:serine hydrolase domain-containing protein [Actinomadura soli]|uniref:serine hydrolase domain-containing protein n=1 Tax=Actinomadura soli TaxID=2508997 RepID=UPI001486DC28|nr:serine hydrolase domain-containing protein [Actinomadura soli]
MITSANDRFEEDPHVPHARRVRRRHRRDGPGHDRRRRCVHRERRRATGSWRAGARPEGAGGGGRTAGEEFQRRLFGPLRLRHTSYPATSPAFPGPYVHGYHLQHGDVSTLISPSSARTSGGIVSTVDDVATFHRALFTGRLLPARQMRELGTVRPVNDEGVVEDYGLGVARIAFSCGYAWGHDGGFPGYRTWTYTSADGRRQAVITYNASGLESGEKFRADLGKAAETAFCA